MDIEKWPGYSLLCRNISDNMNLSGGFYSDQQYQVLFRVDKCVNSSKYENCAPVDEINDFISKIKIETWVATFKSDFNIHDGMPLTENIRWLKSDILKPDSVK